ncbi:MAG: hypothetical protein ACLRQX_03255, partial [Turicibacter sanguinis]
LIDIYDALVTLTEGEMRSLYTLDEFLKTPEEQAREFFEQRLTIDTIVDQYDELMSVAKQYNLTSYMIQLDKLLGQYYFMRNDGQEAVKHFQIAIDRAIKEDINPYHLYQQFGIMLKVRTICRVYFKTFNSHWMQKLKNKLKRLMYC